MWTSVSVLIDFWKWNEWTFSSIYTFDLTATGRYCAEFCTCFFLVGIEFAIRVNLLLNLTECTILAAGKSTEVDLCLCLICSKLNNEALVVMLIISEWWRTMWGTTDVTIILWHVSSHHYVLQSLERLAGLVVCGQSFIISFVCKIFYPYNKSCILCIRIRFWFSIVTNS